MYTLSIMTEISKGSYISHAQAFASLFTDTLNSLTELNNNLAFYTVLTMNHLVPVIGGHQEVNTFYLYLFNFSHPSMYIIFNFQFFFIDDQCLSWITSQSFANHKCLC